MRALAPLTARRRGYLRKRAVRAGARWGEYRRRKVSHNVGSLGTREQGSHVVMTVIASLAGTLTVQKRQGSSGVPNSPGSPGAGPYATLLAFRLGMANEQAILSVPERPCSRGLA